MSNIIFVKSRSARGFKDEGPPSFHSKWCSLESSQAVPRKFLRFSVSAIISRNPPWNPNKTTNCWLSPYMALSDLWIKTFDQAIKEGYAFSMVIWRPNTLDEKVELHGQLPLVTKKFPNCLQKFWGDECSEQSIFFKRPNDNFRMNESVPAIHRSPKLRIKIRQIIIRVKV